MIGFASVKSNSSKMLLIKNRTGITQPKLNLVTVGRDCSFPSPPDTVKACRGRATH